ncbi:hypothetical protein [Actinophytocola sp.]|uniref:hypothetical protein n=1 Tax=Actinophytocola sp. TaxID=1872138 RepID=UPI002ED3B81F
MSQTTRPLRKLVPAAAIGLSALLGIVGCGAGQVAQTAEMEPAVNGSMGQVGDIMLRNVQVAFPENGEAYLAGEDAPLVFTIVNVGGADDELVGVTSPAGQVEIIGDARIPARTSLHVVLPDDNPSATSSEETTTTTTTTGSATSSPSTTTGTSAPGTTSSAPSVSATLTELPPDAIGKISLVITGLTGDLPFGKQVPVTFEFADAGEITVNLPVAAPSTARAEDRDAGEAEGH